MPDPLDHDPSVSRISLIALPLLALLIFFGKQFLEFAQQVYERIAGG